MKIGFIADLHLSGFVNDMIESKSNLPERLNEKKVALYNAIDDLKARSCKILVIAGDLLHNKSLIYSIAQSVLLDFIRDNTDMEFIVIDGNHDLSSKGKISVSSLKCLDNEPNVIRVKSGETSSAGLKDFLFVPYSISISKDIRDHFSKYLVSHFGLNEAQLNSGSSVVSDISIRDLIGKYEYAFLGHYHRPQEIILKDIKLYYTGSITQSDWSEKHEDKRFLIFDTETKQVESILTRGYRKYFELEIKNENREEVIAYARELKQQGGHVILKKTEDVNTLDISKEFVVVDKVGRDISQRGITMSMSEKDKLERYMEIMKVEEEDRAEILREGLDIIQSCSGEV